MPLDAHIEAFEENIHTLASMDVAGMWERLRAEFLDEFVRLDMANTPADEMAKALRAFMDGLSEKPIEGMAQASSGVSYNQGRRVAALEALDEGMATYGVRSALRDTNVCDPCYSLDGEVFEIGTPEYDENEPPMQCEGGGKCRCFMIIIADALGGAA